MLQSIIVLQAPLLLIKDLSKAYGEQVVIKSVSLAVESGQIFGLLGPNGAGKTTMMKIIIRDIQQSSGIVAVDGQVIDSSNHPDLVCYCPQHNPLWPNITLKEHLKLFAIIHGVPYHQADEFCNKYAIVDNF